MIDTPSLLDELQRRNIALSVDADNLKVQAPKGTMTPGLADAIREHKPELIHLLTRQAITEQGTTPVSPAPSSYGEIKPPLICRKCHSTRAADFKMNLLRNRWVCCNCMELAPFVYSLPEPAKPGAEVEQLRREICEMIRAGHSYKESEQGVSVPDTMLGLPEIRKKEATVMDPMSEEKGLVPGFQPISRIIPARHSNRDDRLHDDSPLEAGPTFLPDKAISYQNPYVAKVQAVAPRFQGVPKHPYCSREDFNGASLILQKTRKEVAVNTANILIERELGIPVQKSPVYTAKTLLRDIYKDKPHIIRDTTEDLRDLPFMQSAYDLMFRRELEPEMVGKTVHHFDKNSTYLSAARGTNTGIGDPIHVFDGDDNTHIVPGLPGIYRVAIEHRPDEIVPIIDTDQEWVTSDVLIYARSKGYELTIIEAYVFENYAKILDKWAEKIWNARQALKGTEAYDDMKVIAIVGLGSFATSKEKYPGINLIHPNWWGDTKGKARVNMLANIEKYARETGYPVCIEVDGLYYISNDPNYRTAVPGILDRIGQCGGYKHSGSCILTQEMYEESLTWKPAPEDVGKMAEMFKLAGGEK